MSTPGRIRGPVAALLVLACSAALGACGIATDENPRALPGNTTTTTTPQSDAAGPERGIFWFVQAEALVPVLRPVSEFTPAEFVNTLLVPPESSEGESLSNAIPAGTELLGTRTAGAIVEVDLSSEFEDVVGPGSSRAIGQIVMTLTGLEDVDAVRFAIEGETIDVTSLDPDRGTVQVATTCDYSALLAEPLGETTRISPVQEQILVNKRSRVRDDCS